MKPRIFVSSTFYDLRYIREDLSNFIKAHDFEPIMFEDGDIGYIPGRPLDDSCYKTMKSADMVLLIIGGNYGSPATGEIKDEFKEYMSVTRNEFKEAMNSGIPMYTFIDSKVYAEFEVYEANYDKIEIKRETINFRNTKDINVFRFIREIKGIGRISVIEFEKVTQIKDFLSKQWSDMFKNYLDCLKENESNKKIENTVDEMKTLIKKMNIMLDGVGKKILTTDGSKGYEKVVELQNIILLASEICDIYDLNSISLNDSEESRRKTVRALLLATQEVLKENLWDKLRKNDGYSHREFFNVFIETGVDLNGVDVSGDIKLKEFMKVYENAEEQLVEELIKDENYLELIFDNKNKLELD